MVDHVLTQASQERDRRITLLGDFVVQVSQQRDGRRSKPCTTRAASPHVSLLVEASEMGKTAAPETNVSLLSRMARSLPSVGVEVLLDVWHVASCFLEDHFVETTTSCRDDLRVVLASWARIPVEHGEPILAVHEIAA